MRIKIILIAILLILSIGATVVAAVAAVQDFQRFQAQNASIAAGDVRSIRPWMTIPYISHLCHVPESYLYQSLNIKDTHPLRHTTLHALSLLNHTSVDNIIYRVQQAIDLYRQQHPITETHLPSCLVLPGEIRYSVSRRICT